ncbi:MAG: DUF2256 domain-containing protein [Myxococcota bacterium]|nr:DUF2256 domain-containing protein [Myxococcota bacterium]
MNQTKHCPSCGRSFEWRKKWASNWTEVRYCSALCRRQRLERRDNHLHEIILRLLHAQQPKDGLKASQIADHAFGSRKAADCERVLRAARRLALDAKVIFFENAKRVDATHARLSAQIKLSRGSVDV